MTQIKKQPPVPQTEKKHHHIELLDRERMLLGGVTEVISFQENEALLATQAGEMTISGKNLRMETLEVEAQKMTITGRVNALSYRDGKPARQKQGFFGRAL